ITDLLAARFRDQPHKNTIEQILKELNMNRDGMYVHEIVRDVGNLTRSKCMDYMNALVHTEAVVRINKKGHLFYLDPEKFS
ncbi:DASH complex subunit dam1, partial [Coemansia sp. RSA 921]